MAEKKQTQWTLNRAVTLARSPRTRRQAISAARKHGREVAHWLRFWAKQLPTNEQIAALGGGFAMMEARDTAYRMLRIDADLAAKRGRKAGAYG